MLLKPKHRSFFINEDITLCSFDMAYNVTLYQRQCMLLYWTEMGGSIGSQISVNGLTKIYNICITDLKKKL